ncbi:hypothetical protein [Candidatus Leptofilum sp.]|uniref:hypothetical protein n=1 Tax=Candidatus Leptofilum sp. TaxID=3241576 RepID=UPI003B598F10
MYKSQKYLFWLVVLGCLIILLIDCQNNSEIVLSDVACQPEDVTADPPFVVGDVRTAVPPETFLADQIENYYGVALIENQLTNTSAFCDLFEMADEEAAIEMLARTCIAPQMEEAEPPVVGQEVCALQNTGFRMVNFRQGRVVVSILADSGGFWVDKWAEAVNGRLQK